MGEDLELLSINNYFKEFCYKKEQDKNGCKRAIEVVFVAAG